MLETIHSPDDLKKLSEKELDGLAAEIRDTITETVLQNGGHLASNLGMVEATIALHRVFDSPRDKIIFDVGHQSYTHKLLTGRYESFSTLRQYGGISGFPNRKESEHDVLTEGHCGTSLSAALGIAIADKAQGNDDCVIAVVGDGALTNGMIYEALNNCADRDLRLIILVNDNDMSISGNIGGLHNYLSRIRTSKRYFRFKHGLNRVLSKTPLVGKPLIACFKGTKRFFKRIFVKNTLFEDLGLNYLGPVDGHNIKKLVNVLTEAKDRRKCCIVHIITQKGKGYEPAEKEPDKYHGVAAQGDRCAESSFSERAGSLACALAERDKSVCAITAAMCSGVGLTEFAERFPERFFDVGIAEEHAVTFAGGLAAGGLKPIVFLYSTFAQRSYDQLIHDVAIQNLPVTLMLDRCGIVPGDGITHQGLFDYPLFSAIPNVKIYAPNDYRELERAFTKSMEEDGLSVVRYPKGCECELPDLVREDTLSYSADTEHAEIVIVTFGRMSETACRAAELLGKKHKTGIVSLFRIFPLETERIFALTAHANLVYLLEEGYAVGGVAEKIAAAFSVSGKQVKTVIHAAETFAEHGAKDELFREFGYTPEEIAARAERELGGKSDKKFFGIFRKGL